MGYNRKEIAKRALQARNNGDLELSGMLESLIQLKYSWVPQIKERFLEPDAAGLYTPHRVTLKAEAVQDYINKHGK